MFLFSSLRSCSFSVILSLLFLFFQKDPLRIFYETLFKQVPSSEMSQIWFVLLLFCVFFVEYNLAEMLIMAPQHEHYQQYLLEELALLLISRSFYLSFSTLFLSYQTKRKNYILIPLYFYLIKQSMSQKPKDQEGIKDHQETIWSYFHFKKNDFFFLWLCSSNINNIMIHNQFPFNHIAY